MMLLRKTIALITMLTLAVPVGLFIMPPQNALAVDSFDTCQFGGSCGGRPPGGSLPTPSNPVSDALGGSGTEANVGVTDGGNPSADAVYVTGINRRVVQSMRQPSIATALSAARETKQSLFEWMQTFVLEALKKRLLDMMVAEIVQWIQGGDEPRFVTDWEGFLQDASDIAVAGLVQELELGFLCQPFSRQIQLAVAPEIQPSFQNEAKCTLDDIVGNIESFYENFDNGGWVAYQEMWDPQNNIIGASILTNREKQRRIFASQRAAQNEATTGGSFLSPKACREAIGGTSPDLDKDGILGDVAESCNIVTPGSVVEELTKRAVTVDFDFIVNAQQLSTYLAAIADAAFNRIIRDGVSGLRGLSTDNAPDGGSIADGDDCSRFGVDSDLFDACEDYNGSNDDNFIANRNAVISDIDAARTQYLIALDMTKRSASSSIEILEFLDNAPTMCTDQDIIDNITTALTALEANIATLNELITDLTDAENNINAIPLGDWTEFMKVVNEIQENLNLTTATDAAQYATAQHETILVDIELIEDDVNDCN